MDSNLRVALITTIGVVASSLLTAAATVWVSGNDLRAKTREVERLNTKVSENLTSTSSLLRHVYDNGTLSRSAMSGGKMVIRVNGSTSNDPAFNKVDMTRFRDLCGDDDGCQLTLGATGFRPVNSLPIDQRRRIGEPLIGGPCRFFYNKKSGEWSLSQSCVAVFMIMKSTDQGWVYDRPYAQYEYSSTFGNDDSLTNGADKDGQSLIIMSFKGVCYLTEAAPDISGGKGQLHKDDAGDVSTGVGLYLVASTPAWDYPGVYPTGARGESPWPASDPASKVHSHCRRLTRHTARSCASSQVARPVENSDLKSGLRLLRSIRQAEAPSSTTSKRPVLLRRHMNEGQHTTFGA